MKKNFLFVVALIVVVAGFMACSSTEVVESLASEPASSSEVASDDISSKEVSEEASSEEVAEGYSADEVMKLVDELTAKYQYNNPEHIKALVVAANLDYICSEDLDTILTTYGYTIEDMATLYSECILDNRIASSTTFYYRKGYLDKDVLEPEFNYEKRIMLESVMLNPTDSEKAKLVDVAVLDSAYCDVNMKYEELSTIEIKLYNVLCPIALQEADTLTYSERVLYGYAWEVFPDNNIMTDEKLTDWEHDKTLDPFVAYQKIIAN